MSPRIEVPSSCIQPLIASGYFNGQSTMLAAGLAYVRAAYGGPSPDNTRLSIAVPLWLGPRPAAFAYTIDTGPGP